MSIFESVQRFFAPVDEDYVYDEHGAGMGSVDHQPREGRVVSMDAPAKSEKLTIYTPTSFEDVQFPVADIKSGTTAIINFHKLKAQDAERVSFFLQGVVVALNGEFTQIAEQTMVFAPNHVGIEQKSESKRARNHNGGLFGSMADSVRFGT